MPLQTELEQPLRQRFHSAFKELVTCLISRSNNRFGQKNLAVTINASNSLISQLLRDGKEQLYEKQASTYFKWIKTALERCSQSEEFLAVFPKLRLYTSNQFSDDYRKFDFEQFQTLLDDVFIVQKEDTNPYAENAFDKTTSTLQNSFWIGYQWGIEDIEISFWNLSYPKLGQCKGPVYFQFYDRNTFEPLPEQRGSFRINGSLLTIYTNAKHQPALQTFLALKIKDVAHLENIEPGVNLIGAYTTVHRDHEPSSGAIWLEKLQSEEAVKKKIEIIITNKRQLLPRKNLEQNRNQVVDWSEFLLSPLPKIDISAEIYYFLYNKRVDTRFKGLDQPFSLLSGHAHHSYLDRIVAIEQFEGVYEGDYVDVVNSRLESCLLVVLKNGRTFVRMPDQNWYKGFFRAVRAGDILLGLFQKDALKEYHRLRIVIDTKKIQTKDCYYGLYSGIDRQSNFPVVGRIRFTKIRASDSTSSKQTVQEFLKAHPLTKKDLDPQQLFKDDLDLFKFLTGQLELNGTRLSDSIAFYENLLASSNLSWKDVSSTRKLSPKAIPSEAGKKFKGIYVCYSISSTSPSSLVHSFPIRIHDDGLIEIKSRSRNYLGQAFLLGEILVLNFNRDEAGLPHFVVKHIVVRRRTAQEQRPPTHYFGISNRLNSNSVLRSSQDILVPTLDKWDKLKYEADALANTSLGMKTRDIILSSLTRKAENLLIVEQGPGEYIKPKTDLGESFFAAACHYAFVKDKLKTIEHLHLAHNHGLDLDVIQSAIINEGALAEYKNEVQKAFPNLFDSRQ